MDSAGQPAELHKPAAPDLERTGKKPEFATESTEKEKSPQHYINILANPGQVRKLVSLPLDEENWARDLSLQLTAFISFEE